MRWYLLLAEDEAWPDLIKQFEWDMDCFGAAFVRCSPGTVMQNHLEQPRHVLTAVTTLEPALLVHHFAQLLQYFNRAFLFAPHACWFMQYVLLSHAMALLPLVVRSAAGLSTLAPPPLEVCVADSDGGGGGGQLMHLLQFSAELHVLLPLLVLCAVLFWLDSSLAAGRHLRRCGERAVRDVQKAIKDDYYLIGKELQNSVQVRTTLPHFLCHIYHHTVMMSI
jgi:hypothetical protein